MNYKINLTPKAQSDLKEIFRYIAVDLQSIQNATGQLDRLEKAISSLEQMPERYRVYDKEPWRSRNLRIMTVDNYLVLYVPNKEERTVTVIRIMYGGRDIDSQLNFNK
ncbi:MAG: type II toxin-antitoxin system RelE/ParE family toxin [Ruminococcus sp.]|nr:type II toxin-antitoxin system RelE/ParE family toxin [Ruminococcus sp.]MCI5616834.1 type II toxin-antitoxin system RelE/ParE family toxin [Ruminococcus sp.]MCI6506185.1 type II toxin-antitoxin system RelE/ParE family toxin [Ruminococcus sp.]MDD5889297.1 type II toxin-antitoxin system RelE/ParE family toxin [Ruminococcus sp.]MDD6709789.1 type II toxin-antitoxin system RelE/ParE family toxin [Ruminococcus sp.]